MYHINYQNLQCKYQAWVHVPVNVFFFYPTLSSEVQYGTVNIFYVCTTSVENGHSKVIIV